MYLGTSLLIAFFPIHGTIRIRTFRLRVINLIHAIIDTHSGVPVSSLLNMISASGFGFTEKQLLPTDLTLAFTVAFSPPAPSTFFSSNRQQAQQVHCPLNCWKDVVDFGSYGSVIDRSSSGALQMVREGAIDCLIVYGINHTEMSLLRYQGSARRNKGMWGNTEIGVVIHEKDQDVLLMFYLYTRFYR